MTFNEGGKFIMSQRQDTCHGKTCPFWKRYGEYCPNYVDGKWVTNDGHEYVTKDCAPKRSMILSQQLYDFMVCTRKDYNGVRNATEKMLQFVAFNNGVDLEIVDGNVVDDNLQMLEE